MSEFVDECRREWKRLHVPTAIADEMADDLTADLREAEADGASAEEVLGSGASDPRAFAAAWASERGIVRQRWSDRIRRPRLLAGIALLVLVAGAGAAVALLAISGDAARPGSTVTEAPAFGPGVVIGTSIFGANVPPSNIALVTGRRRTVLHKRPRSVTITFGNTGRRTVDSLRLFVEIGRHSYRFTLSRVVPNSRRAVHIDLPADLPREFRIVARTQPVAGETNTTNNQQTWRVTMPQ